ncbi:exodeoxyribonuclease V subunit alpha [Xanthomonas sp. CFBP 8445]|uniref:exodeoxyribonuclease V subunit alpha n=1 Tax=Xanthomonas sp. CFBP 8445 TaxID=2971236 RepID=UPI0021E04D67|nr:exodeoxyribonuclease V subunit alpha [Xanthomonas sp. CFBP 8445]UYC12332.1 exodeoxyribonuclease V subunit alpha [Xanthomonas sp. CFBP 8445]
MSQPTNLLATLYRTGTLRTLDHAFAHSLARLDPDTPDLVLAGAALASLAVASGHAGLDPARASLLLDSRDAAPPALPTADDWTRALAASRWVAQPAAEDPASPDCPLVLEHGLLYLRRYREYERRLALGLRRLAVQPLPHSDLAALAPLFAQLFPLPPGEGARRAGEGPTANDPSDRQAQAAALALRRALLLVTGGPGTGKTTTIARLLLLRVAQARAAGLPPPRIALAAPTGRAAERMAESLRAAVARALADGVDPALAEALPAGASTLHRLLGVIPDLPRFRHDADNPLPFDLIVIDEASMVDLPLMCKLVDAVADGAQLILLGDADQLPSVEAGDVLAAILQAAGPGDALQADDAQALQPLLGHGAVADDHGGLAGHRVHLLRGYRQAQDFALAPLADAVRSGDADGALRLLRDGQLAGVHFHDGVDDALAAGGDALLAHWRALGATDDPAEALRAAARLRLLTAVRAGPQGARGLNARIEQLLAETASGARRLGAAAPWFHGRLLLITENSYRHGLFNGDVGICLRDAQGTLVAWFDGAGDGQVRGFHPAALPAHESAFAMTVHKAQGSEFEEVWLQLPARDARVLSRELVYTGITRARRALHIAASEAVLRAALARHAARISGLAWRLGGAEPSGDPPPPPRPPPPTPPAKDEPVPSQGSLF